MSIKISMKKFTIIATMVFFSLLSIPAQSFATAASPGDSTKDAQIVARIVARVTEIQNMDKTNLSPAEKKELKKELMEMKKKADNSRGVYLSIGAIIIIILLLILIL